MHSAVREERSFKELWRTRRINILPQSYSAQFLATHTVAPHPCGTNGGHAFPQRSLTTYLLHATEWAGMAKDGDGAHAQRGPPFSAASPVTSAQPREDSEYSTQLMKVDLEDRLSSMYEKTGREILDRAAQNCQHAVTGNNCIRQPRGSPKA